MSTENKFELTGSGSVSYKKNGKLVSHKKGDRISKKQLKQVPKRQKDFFEEVEVKEEESADTNLEEQIADDHTVGSLKDALDEAEVDYTSGDKKADLIEKFIEHVHEE